MRLSDDQIKAGFFHTEKDVRDAIAFYYARSHSLDPKIMLLVRQTIGEFGLDAFDLYQFMSDLVQTDDSIAWLIAELERIGAGSTYQEHSYSQNLVRAVCEADPLQLKQFEESIRAIAAFDDASKQQIRTKIELLDRDPESLWAQLLAIGDVPRELTEQEFQLAGLIAESLGRFPNEIGPKVLEILDGAASPTEWQEGIGIRAAGELRLVSAATLIVPYLGDSDWWFADEAHFSAAMIGGDAIVSQIRQRYRDASDGFRFGAASTLEDVHTDLSVQTALELLEIEDDADRRGSLLQSVLMNFSPFGIEPARQHILNTPKSPEVLEVRSALLTACKLIGNRFPEFDEWEADSKTDVEFRKAWYKSHPLRQLVDEDEEFDLGTLSPDRIEDYLTTIHRPERIGRNDPCPCGSGKKFKRCCMRQGNGHAG